MLNVNVNGMNLVYSEKGEGQPVVFVHGIFNDFRSWTNQMKAFSSNYRAISLSCRFHYPNEPIPEGTAYHLGAVAEDLASFLQKLDIAPVHLIGSSSGAFVCLLLSHKKPELIRSLVLAEPPVLSVLGVSIPPKPLELFKLLTRSPATAFDVVKFGAKGIGPSQKAFARGDDEKGVQTFTQTVLGKETAANMTEFMRIQIKDNIGPFRALLQTGLPHFSAIDARSIRVPTLLVAGEHSAPAQHRVTDELYRIMPHVERIDISDASHLMYEDQPQEFNSKVLAFLSKNR